jgi:hypothetical protein
MKVKIKTKEHETRLQESQASQLIRHSAGQDYNGCLTLRVDLS